jgi:hypothetical protein
MHWAVERGRGIEGETPCSSQRLRLVLWPSRSQLILEAALTKGRFLQDGQYGVGILDCISRHFCLAVGRGPFGCPVAFDCAPEALNVEMEKGYCCMADGKTETLAFAKANVKEYMRCHWPSLAKASGAFRSSSNIHAVTCYVRIRFILRAHHCSDLPFGGWVRAG